MGDGLGKEAVKVIEKGAEKAMGVEVLEMGLVVVGGLWLGGCFTIQKRDEESQSFMPLFLVLQWIEKTYHKLQGFKGDATSGPLNQIANSFRIRPPALGIPTSKFKGGSCAPVE